MHLENTIKFVFFFLLRVLKDISVSLVLGRRIRWGVEGEKGEYWTCVYMLDYSFQELGVLTSGPTPLKVICHKEELKEQAQWWEWF